MCLIYGEYLVNVHFSDIPHTFIPHFTLHSAEKIRIEFSTNYPLTTFCIRNMHSAKYPFPINGAQETFTGRYSCTCAFQCCGNFTGWAHKYTKLRTVSLSDVNSLTCIALYFLWGDPSPAGL